MDRKWRKQEANAVLSKTGNGARGCQHPHMLDTWVHVLSPAWRGLIVASDHVQPFGSQHNLDKSGDWRNEGGSESESEQMEKSSSLPKDRLD
ncbi:hypothetical protein PoMZ_12701 [Pyricularia oryzae]|uniref:Uncharacterized protein n=1 Tax=Pyricularia oryzae TaxID=318829 RepID=A0A4V1C858_PYROR|nr:hypothetical protein PoMZ_12701 [Pyricularia oryzae]